MVVVLVSDAVGCGIGFRVPVQAIKQINVYQFACKYFIPLALGAVPSVISSKIHTTGSNFPEESRSVSESSERRGIGKGASCSTDF